MLFSNYIFNFFQIGIHNGKSFVRLEYNSVAQALDNQKFAFADNKIQGTSVFYWTSSINKISIKSPANSCHAVMLCIQKKLKLYVEFQFVNNVRVPQYIYVGRKISFRSH